MVVVNILLPNDALDRKPDLERPFDRGDFAPRAGADYEACQRVQDALLADEAILSAVQQTGEFLSIPQLSIVSTAAPSIEHAEAIAKKVDPNARVEKSLIYRAVSVMWDEERPGTANVGAAEQTTPWGVEKVQSPAVWRFNFLGEGIRVAVLDTGVGPHTDLPQPVAGATFVPGTNTWADDGGHGTHVAGTIAAKQNDIGVVGVAPRASLMAGKVLAGSGGGNNEWIAEGIRWAADNGANVINLSLGGGESDVIKRAVAYAVDERKVVICAAAGNGGCRPVIWPAADPRCIAVAATDRSNNRCSFSNCGPELDVAAPGCPILSTWLNNSYVTASGTSMATPHVAGVVALLLSRERLTPQQVMQRLKETALPAGPANQFGSGIVQADKAVLRDPLPSPPPPPNPCPPSPNPPNQPSPNPPNPCPPAPRPPC